MSTKTIRKRKCPYHVDNWYLALVQDQNQLRPFVAIDSLREFPVEMHTQILKKKLYVADTNTATIWLTALFLISSTTSPPTTRNLVLVVFLLLGKRWR